MQIKKRSQQRAFSESGFPLNTLISSLLEMLASATRQGKEMKGTNTEKETYTALLTDNILCTQKTQNDLPITIKIPKFMQRNIR